MSTTSPSRSRRFFGITTRLIACFVLSALLPLGWLAYEVHREVSAQLEASARRTLAQTTESLARAVELQAQTLRAELTTLLAETLLAPGARGDVGEVLPVPTPDGSSFREVRWYPALSRLESIDGELSDWQRRRLAAGDWVWRDADREDSITLLTPLAGEPERGVVVAVMSRDAWAPREAIEELQISCMFSDEDGALWFGSRAHADDPLEQMSARAGIGESVLPFGSVHQYVRNDPLQVEGFERELRVGASCPCYEVFASLYAFRWRFGWIAAVGLLAALLISSVQIRRLLNPIRALNRAAREFGKENFSRRVELRTGDEFEELGASFNQMAERIATLREEEVQVRAHLIDARDRAIEASKKESDFVQNVSHELLTPLTSILSSLEILSEHQDLDPESREEFLEIARHESHKLEELLTRLLDFDAMQSPPPHAEATSCCARELLLEIARDYEESIEHAGLQLRTHLELQRERILVDPQGLAEALHELLSNAMRHGPEGSEILLDARECSGVIEIRVIDQGPGVAKVDRESVFEPFRQCSLDPSTDKPRGTGLGLTLARGHLDRYAGTLEVEERSDCGACFLIRLARFDEPAGAEAETEFDLEQAPSLAESAVRAREPS